MFGFIDSFFDHVLIFDNTEFPIPDTLEGTITLLYHRKVEPLTLEVRNQSCPVRIIYDS